MEAAESSVKVYKQRWGMLAALVALNVSCGALWINNLTTATTVATYYDVEPEAINWFATMSFLVAVPAGFVVPYFVDRFGVKLCLHVGSAMNLLSAVIRAISTSGLFEGPHTQYYVGLFGQFFSALANCLFLALPPKISQLWFLESERGLSTAIGAMARPLGVIITQFSTPHIITSPDKVPLSNYVWLAPAVLAQALTIIFVTRSQPKTAPSLSAENQSVSKEPFLNQMKKVVSSKGFLLLAFSVGSGMGVVLMLGSLSQQLLCPLGYSEVFAGAMNGSLLLAGFFGAFTVSYILKKSRKMIELIKVYVLIAGITLIGLFELLLISSAKGLLLTFAILFGFVGNGLLPLGLELAVEVTYPIEQTIGGSLMFMTGQFLAMIFIIITPLLARDISDTSQSTCGEGITSKDYSVPMMVVLSIAIFFSLALVLFFNTEYKRMNADIRKNTSNSISSGSSKHNTDIIQKDILKLKNMEDKSDSRHSSVNQGFDRISENGVNY